MRAKVCSSTRRQRPAFFQTVKRPPRRRHKGRFVVTDSEGMYNLPVVENGALVIALDPASLPAGYTIADGGRRENQGYARLLRTPLQGGALLKQDFAIESNSVQPTDPGRAFDRAKDT